MAKPTSLRRDISPPPSRKHSLVHTQAVSTAQSPIPADGKVKQQLLELDIGPSLAAIEAGEAHIRDHLEYFAKHLNEVRRPASDPRLSISDFQTLYKCNQHSHGHHFVIHQHDHPISGVHYDLRLQFSGSSTVSWAVPYGMPGNPISIRPNRMAIETRVHNLWVRY